MRAQMDDDHGTAKLKVLDSNVYAFAVVVIRLHHRVDAIASTVMTHRRTFDQVAAHISLQLDSNDFHTHHGKL